MGPTKDDERRGFTDEFKQDAVRLVTTDGYTFAAAVKSLGIGEQSLQLTDGTRLGRSCGALASHRLPLVDKLPRASTECFPQ